MKRLISALAVPLALTTTACGQAMKQPDIKLNPHPKMRYEITLTVEDAPGPFDAVEGVVFYKVADSHCVPIVYENGSFFALGKHMPFALRRISDVVYKGEFFTDFLVDEDYFGKGTCHWVVGLVSANLKKASVTLNPSINVDPTITYRDDMDKNPVTRFFPNQVYSADDRTTLSGYVNRSDIPQDSKGSFSIMLKVDEKFK